MDKKKMISSVLAVLLSLSSISTLAESTGLDTNNTVEYYSVAESLEIVAHPSSYTLLSGKQVTMKVEAKGSGLKYQWQYSVDGGKTWYNNVSSGANTASMSFTMKKDFDNRLFHCVVTDDMGNTVTSNAAYVKVCNVEIVKQPQSQYQLPGKTVTVKVEANGTVLSYQWQYSIDDGKTWYNNSSSGANTASMSFTMKNDFDNRLFHCVITDDMGNKVTSNAARLQVGGVEIVKQPQSQYQLSGKPVTMKVEANGTGLKYQWQYSVDGGKTWVNNSSTGANTASMSFTMSNAFDNRLFHCVITDGNGIKVTSNAAKVQVGGVEIVKQPQSQFQLPGKQVTMKVEANGTGLKYQWQYSVNGGSTWYNNTSAGANTASMSFTMSTNFDNRLFRCVITDDKGIKVTSNAACLQVGGVEIIKQPQSQFQLPGKQVTLKVEANGTNLKYQWQYSVDGGKTWTNNSSAGANTASMSFTMSSNFNNRLFRCIITDGKGIKVTSNVAKLQVGGVEIVKQPQSQYQLPGKQVTMKVEANGTGLKYQWQYSVNGGSTWYNNTSAGANTASMSFTMSTDFDNRLFRCVITDENGIKVTSNTAFLMLGGIDIVTQPANHVLFAGEQVNLKVTANGTGLKYQWQYSVDEGVTWYNNTSAGANTSTMSFPMKEDFNNRLFHCVITDDKGNKATTDAARVQLRIRQTPRFTTLMLDETKAFCTMVPVAITNNGSLPMRIYSNLATLIDHDYSGYNRSLYLADPDNYFAYIPYKDIPAKTTVAIPFIVRGNSTWYDYKSRVVFNFDYDGLSYKGSASYYYGSSYSKN